MDSFLSDGLSREEAEQRAQDFVSDADRCVTTIWEDEKARIDKAEGKIDNGYKVGCRCLTTLVTNQH